MRSNICLLFLLPPFLSAASESTRLESDPRATGSTGGSKPAVSYEIRALREQLTAEAAAFRGRIRNAPARNTRADRRGR